MCAARHPFLSGTEEKMKIPVAGLAAAAMLGAVSVPLPVLFEPKPRAVASGRDPVLAVRASGAISLLKVEKSDLYLQTSLDGGDTFERPVRVNDVPGEVSSHPESSPQLALRSRSEFYCLWQSRTAGNPDGSVLRFARSVNWGESFSKAIPVDASQAASQSFFTMNVAPNGSIYAAWLDGRDRGKGRPGTSAVYVARSTDKGASFQPAVRVTLDACPCCRPSIAFGDDRTVHIAWRRVLDDNVRDVFVSTSTDSGATWSDGVRVAEDNWKLNGCPHSGGAMAVFGKRLYIAWHTVREGKAQIYLSSSDDHGQSFSGRASISEAGLDPNHPVLENAGDRVAIAFQARDAREKNGWAPLNVYYREIDLQGRLSPLQRVGSAGASVSYPVLAFEEPGRLFVAWTESVQDGRAVILSRGRRR
jgi:hypothetical protein